MRTRQRERERERRKDKDDQVTRDGKEIERGK